MDPIHGFVLAVINESGIWGELVCRVRWKAIVAGSIGGIVFSIDCDVYADVGDGFGELFSFFYSGPRPGAGYDVVQDAFFA